MSRQNAETMRSGSSESTSANLEHSQIQHQHIEALAYQLWLQRGSPVGSDQEDWFEAERELRTAQSLHLAA